MHGHKSNRTYHLWVQYELAYAGEMKRSREGRKDSLQQGRGSDFKATRHRRVLVGFGK
jgi:hypothetical protein